MEQVETLLNEIKSYQLSLQKSFADSETGNQKMAAEVAKLQDELVAIAKKTATNPDHTNAGVTFQSAGSTFVNSDNYKHMLAGGHTNSGKVHVKAITNATLNTSQPLVQGYRVPEIFANPQRQLTVRDLLPTLPTTSNLIEFAKENTFTNSAAPVYVSPNFENVAKAESDITFTLATAPVRTIAHFIAASKQVLQDSAQLQAYIESRLSYGLALKTENQILNGDGSSGSITGLLTSASSYDSGANVSGDTRLDKIRHAIAQAAASEYLVDGIVLNHADWQTIELIKDAASNVGNYVLGNPASTAQKMVWGVPVTVTNSIASGTFLVGAFGMGAAVYDRQDATIEVSTSHSDFFTKNMVAILAEERLALAVYRSSAFITGSF